MSSVPAKGGGTRLHRAGITLDLDAHTLERGSERFHVTPKECLLMATFITHEGQVLTRQYLMQKVWNTDYFNDMRTLEVHVHWLRRKIEQVPSRPRLIHTIRGVGYLFKPDQ